MFDAGSMFDSREIALLEGWRHKLHQYPEISNEEAGTARAVVEFLADTMPDATITQLGGHGVALAYEGSEPGPTVLLRCELDALQIQEISDIPYRSRRDGKSHMCGHDGHMAMMAGVARVLGRCRPSRGRAVLLFQPAEETADGAAAVLGDAKFGMIAPDYSFAIHNMPGLPSGHVAVATGQITCASMGLCVVLTGKTAHASRPEAGISPAVAVARIIPAVKELEAADAIGPGFRRIALTNIQMGRPVYGITPGAAEIRMTLRTPESGALELLLAEVLDLVGQIAGAERLTISHSTHNFFRACINDPDATAVFESAVGRMGLGRVNDYVPIRGSEDFGIFGSCSKSAMLFLGAGTDRPMVHNPDYDFPDELIPIGAGIFLLVLEELLGLPCLPATAAMRK